MNQMIPCKFVISLDNRKNFNLTQPQSMFHSTGSLRRRAQSASYTGSPSTPPGRRWSSRAVTSYKFLCSGFGLAPAYCSDRAIEKSASRDRVEERPPRRRPGGLRPRPPATVDDGSLPVATRHAREIPCVCSIDEDATIRFPLEAPAPAVSGRDRFNCTPCAAKRQQHACFVRSCGIRRVSPPPWRRRLRALAAALPRCGVVGSGVAQAWRRCAAPSRRHVAARPESRSADVTRASYPAS